MNIYDEINKIYEMEGFMTRYGIDFWITVIIVLAFVIAITYFMIMNKIEPIKADWDNQKCNPQVIPFAGLINAPRGMGSLEYTARNFTYCAQSMLQNIVYMAIKPFYYLMNNMNVLFDQLANALNAVRAVFNNIRNILTQITDTIMNRILNMIIAVLQLNMKIKDMLDKIMGTLKAALFTFLGSYLGMRALFAFIVELIVKILLIIASTIIMMWIIFSIPVIGAWALPVAVMYTLVMIAILVPTIYIKVFMDKVMSMSTPRTPKVPGCFAGDTMISLKNGHMVPLRDVKPGDEIHEGGIVTGVIKFAADDQNIYRLHGVVVTGEHRVYHADRGWIQVKEHEHSEYLPRYHINEVYCLLTSKKIIVLNGVAFSDWDDIDTDVVACLRTNCANRGYIPQHFIAADLHLWLESGLRGDTLLKMNDGETIAIKDVTLRTQLYGGRKVLGIVKLYAKDLGLYQHEHLGMALPFVGTQNIQIRDPANLGVIHNLMGKQAKPVRHNESEVYQLLTDTGDFVVYGQKEIIVRHYNSGLDTYIDHTH